VSHSYQILKKMQGWSIDKPFSDAKREYLDEELSDDSIGKESKIDKVVR
jgi:hypothetical protein